MSKYNLIDIYEQYQIGSGWTRDFDYDGMLKAGLKTGVDTDIELLKKMAEDYTDVNYHREASHLYNAIEALEENAIKEASMFFGDFHAEIEETMKSQGMDIEPTLGKFMASKMEEDKDKEPKDKEPRDGVKSAASKLGIKPKHVKEVTSREGSRIEGLLSIPLKSKFLNAFEELYFDLVEEDPFHAEDVIEHLSIEMIKHLDDIQAQGDRLAGIEQEEFIAIDELDNTLNIDKVASPDAKAHDYGAEIKGISDEDDTEEKYAHGMVLPLEEMFGPVKFLKSKGIDDDIIADFMKTHAEDIVGASEDEIMDEFENFRSVNYDYIDEDLRTHFKRFI
jgi:hypothetical protein